MINPGFRRESPTMGSHVGPRNYAFPCNSFTCSRFEILPEVLHDGIVLSTPLGENVRSDRVYNDCPIVV